MCCRWLSGVRARLVSARASTCMPPTRRPLRAPRSDDVDAELGADSGNASEEDGEDGAERAKKPRRTRFLISGQTTARQTLLSQ